jgi:3-oxoadipyl-CoA thiolase
MALLLAGLPDIGSRPDAQPPVRLRPRRGRRGGARDPRRRDRSAIAGGVESMTRAPFVMGKATEAFSRSAEIYDTTIGWRFINPLMKAQYGVDAMPETGENVAEDSRCRAPTRTRSRSARSSAPGAAIASGYFAEEITPVTVPAARPDRSRSTRTSIRARDHAGRPRQAEADRAQSRHGDGRQRLRRQRRRRAMILASEAAVKKHGLTPRARILGMASPACRRASWASARCRRRAS